MLQGRRGKSWNCSSLSSAAVASNRPLLQHMNQVTAAVLFGLLEAVSVRALQTLKVCDPVSVLMPLYRINRHRICLCQSRSCPCTWIMQSCNIWHAVQSTAHEMQTFLALHTVTWCVLLGKMLSLQQQIMPHVVLMAKLAYMVGSDIAGQTNVVCLNSNGSYCLT